MHLSFLSIAFYLLIQSYEPFIYLFHPVYSILFIEQIDKFNISQQIKSE